MQFHGEFAQFPAIFLRGLIKSRSQVTSLRVAASTNNDEKWFYNFIALITLKLIRIRRSSGNSSRAINSQRHFESRKIAQFVLDSYLVRADQFSINSNKQAILAASFIQQPKGREDEWNVANRFISRQTRDTKTFFGKLKLRVNLWCKSLTYENLKMEMGAINSNENCRQLLFV